MIYIDVSAAVHARAGLGRYTERLAASIAATDPARYALFNNLGHDGKIPASLASIRREEVQAGYKPWRMAVLLGQFGRIGFNHLVPDCELFHATEHLLMPVRGVPSVLTVHDLIFKLFPEYHKRLNYWYLNRAMPLYCQRADHIIAVSEATKRDIVTHYAIDPAKITVVHEAASEHFRVPDSAEIERVRAAYQLPDRFLLHLSTIEPRKNLSRLVQALKQLRATQPDLQLVLVGSKGWLYEDFFAEVTALGLDDAVQRLGWVPDEDLPAVIAAAALAVQPSLYEGFGLPILEHMACGQVVAASDASSFPEVGGDAAAYFDPTDVDGMVHVIGRILSDPDEYSNRRELGLKQAAKFSWQRTATETIAVYERLLAK